MQERLRNLVIETGIALAIGFVLALVGPFGSYGASLAQRIGYWVPLIFVGYAIMRPGLLLGEMAAAKLDLPRWPTVITAMAITNAPLSLVIFWFNGNWPRLPSADIFLLQYANVGVISLIVFTVYMLVGHGETEEQAAGAEIEEPAEATSSFHDRLPYGFTLKALEMEDHYVRAHGAEGRSELILMRLRDAIAELDGVDGAQVHRSWWVAREAVTGSRRDGRRIVLELGHELEAPVARDRASELKAEGWL